MEFFGTFVITLVYYMSAEQEAAILLGYWIIALFAIDISGAHFNPAISLVCMIREKSNLGRQPKQRLLGIVFILVQIGGATCGILVSALVDWKFQVTRPAVDIE